MPRRPIRNVVLPVVILFPLIALMVGCLYIPTFEHTDTLTIRQDFRPLISDDKSVKPIRANHFSIAQAEALLGPPCEQSDNGQNVLYFLTTRQGVWVAPQCFEAFSADQKLYCLSLQFDETGMLKHFDVITEEYANGPGMWELLSVDEESRRDSAKERAIEEADRRNGLNPEDYRRPRSQSPFFIQPSRYWN